MSPGVPYVSVRSNDVLNGSLDLVLRLCTHVDVVWRVLRAGSEVGIFLLHPLAVCGKDGQRARRRAPCARSVRRPPETSLRSPWHAPVHDMLMLHTRRTGAMTVCAHGRCKGKGARESRLDWVLHAMGSGRGSGCVLLCNGLLRLCVSVDRERSRVRPLPAYVSRALKTGRLSSLSRASWARRERSSRP